MGPALEHGAAAVGEGAMVECGMLVMANARKYRQVVRAHQHIDAVDLQQVHLADGIVDAGPVRRALSRRLGEALGREGHATGLGK